MRGQVKFRSLNLPDVENFPELQSFSVSKENFYIGCQINIWYKGIIIRGVLNNFSEKTLNRPVAKIGVAYQKIYIAQ